MKDEKKIYKGKRTLGVITARGGSRGIPRKNIKDLCGKPLIAYTIEAAHKSQYLTRCVISTDDEEIAQVVKSHGGEVPFMRPSDLAQDKSASIPVIQHALSWLQEHEGLHYDYAMILQPTSPFRTAEDIDSCIQKIVDTGADSVMSMVELTDFSLKKLKKLDGDLLVPLVQEEGKTSAARTDMERTYKRNCAIYLTRTDLIMGGDLFGQVSRAYVMPRDCSVDINEPIDFELAEFLMRSKLIG